MNFWSLKIKKKNVRKMSEKSVFIVKKLHSLDTNLAYVLLRLHEKSELTSDCKTVKS